MRLYIVKVLEVYVLLLLTRQLTKELNSMAREQFECLMTQSNEVAGAPPSVVEDTGCS